MASVTHQYGISQEEYEELVLHHCLSFNIISSIQKTEESELESKYVHLDRKTSNSKLIIFDLDETLAHATHWDNKEEQEKS